MPRSYEINFKRITIFFKSGNKMRLKCKTFDLNIVDFDTEKIIDEDYSNDVHQYIPFNELIE